MIISVMVKLSEIIIFLIELWINLVLLVVMIIFMLVKCLLRLVIIVSILLEIFMVFEFVCWIIFILIIGCLFKCIIFELFVGLKYILVILLMCILLLMIMLLIFWVDIDVVLVCIINVWFVDWILLVGILKGVRIRVLVILVIDKLKLVRWSGLMDIWSMWVWLLFKFMFVIFGIFKNSGVMLVFICLVRVFIFNVLFEIVRLIMVWVLLLVWIIEICFMFLGSCCWIWLIDLWVLLVVFFKLMSGWNFICIWVEFFLFWV